MRRPFASEPVPYGAQAAGDLLVVGSAIERGWIDPGRGARFLERLEPGFAGRPDLLVATTSAIDPALIAWLAAPAQGGMPVILLTEAGSIDAAGAILAHNIIAFIAIEQAEADLDRTIAEALHRKAGGVAEREDRFQTQRRVDLEALREDAERMARALAELLGERGREPSARRPVDAPRIRAHIRARRLRERFFPADLFADPAWDILLDLAAAEREGVRVSVSSLCIAASVPTTTGLRWIKAMVDRGMLQREPDPNDARRAFITMAPATSKTMDACMDACFNLPGL